MGGSGCPPTRPPACPPRTHALCLGCRLPQVTELEEDKSSLNTQLGTLDTTAAAAQQASRSAEARADGLAAELQEAQKTTEGLSKQVAEVRLRARPVARASGTALASPLSH